MSHSEFTSVCLYNGWIIGIDSRGDAWAFAAEPPDFIPIVHKLKVQAKTMDVAIQEFDRMIR